MSELFNIPETLSPRLRWMRKHNIGVIDGIWNEANAAWEYAAFQGKISPGGDRQFGKSEEEAIVALAKKLNIKLWNE